MEKNAFKKFINNFKKFLEKNILFKYVFYLLVLLLIYGILQLIFPNTKNNSNNVDDINAILNMRRTNNVVNNTSTNSINNIENGIIDNTINDITNAVIDNSIINSINNEI